jgi:uncharacterized protein YegL
MEADPSVKEFTRQEARPLPVILLLDVSGSMHDHGKIDALNQAVQEMINSFKREQSFKAEIHLTIITFGARPSISSQTYRNPWAT